jgi:membrane protein implicated in regulation of membrane protease activity
MIGLYIFAAVIGGVLVALSALGVGHDAEAGVELHADGSMDAGGDTGDAGGDAADPSTDQVGGSDFWLALISLRFWTYFAAFFGLTGLALTWFSGWSAAPIAGAAVAVGLLSGGTITALSRWLSKSQASSAIETRDLIGAEGTVLVPVRAFTPGKVRIELRGEAVDLTATADHAQELCRGTQVMVVGIEGRRVTVVPKSELRRAS